MIISMRIPATGGAGYNGGHTVLVLAADSLCNRKEAAVVRLREISGSPVESEWI